MADPLLDLDIRRRIVGLIREYPGLHVRDLARRLQTSVALVEYHLPLLLEAGLLSEVREDRYQRLFLGPEGGGAALPEGDRRVLGILRERLPLRIVLHLLDQKGPARHKEVADALGLGKSKLSFHLRKLESAGVVEKTEEGAFRPKDRRRLMRLLHAHPPAPDLREEFADVWLSLYGDRA